jgi:hypothetical protein
MKIINDTLKKPNGKWNRQALTMFLFSVLGAITGLYVVVSDYFLEKEINQHAIIVVGLFLTMASGQAVVTTWNKRIDRQMDIDQEPNPQYTNDDDSGRTY